MSSKHIDEKQLTKLKKRISFSMPKREFLEKYQSTALKPDIYFYQCFRELLTPKWAKKREALLDELLANHVLIPDTLIQYEGVEGSTRIKLDPGLAKYVISQGEHVKSVYYNQRRKIILELMGLTSALDDENLDMLLLSKPIAVEKNIGTDDTKPVTKVLNAESLKVSALKDSEGDKII